MMAITSGLKFKIERRQAAGPRLQIISLVMALTGALLVMALLMRIAGANVWEGYVALYTGSFGNWEILLDSLVKATPLILTGLATTIAFRGKIWNIGVEGQLYAGAIAAYWAYVTFGKLSPVVLVSVILAAGMVGGAAWAWIAAIIKAKFEVNEIISTIMLNYIVLFLLSWLLSGPWREPNSHYHHSSEIADWARFPMIVGDSRLHIGFVVAIIAAIIIYLLLDKTPQGYEIRAMGFNPVAARFQGMDVNRLLITVMLISGAVAGLAGTGELFGVHHRLKSDISLGYGFTGIIIAMLAGLHPLVVVPAGILFGGLINGSFMLQITTGVPAALVNVFQAVVLLFLLSAASAINYRLSRVQVEAGTIANLDLRRVQDG